MSSLERYVSKCQKKLSREDLEDKKAIKYLRELNRLDITVGILKATGIGKTVNKFRKHGEELGMLATGLVKKWKALAIGSQETGSSQQEATSPQSRGLSLLNSSPKPKKEQAKPSSLQLCDVSFGCELPAVPRSKHKKKHTEKRMNHTSPGREPQGLPSLPPVASITDALLPEIQPTYRPMRLPDTQDSPLKRKRSLVEVEDEVGELISSRRSRTQVFSGRRAPGTSQVMHSLYDLAMRVLIAHIDALQDTGGVPYDILAPLLAKCTPQQLLNIEEYNQYFIEDTGPLWKNHCQRDFKSSQPRGRQTWRELYLTNQEERETRLKRINEKIIASQAAKKPERTVKLAYVTTEAKPPPQVRRKQAKFGTGHTDAVFKPGPSRVQITSGSSSASPPGKKVAVGVAPMMKKTMQMLKVQRNIGSAKIKRR